MNFNRVVILGRLTNDPDRRNLPSGQAVVNFSMATNRYYTTQQGEKRDEVEFHNIVIFGKMAETASQYLKKGSLALIEGRLKTRNWDDKATGQKKYKTEIIADSMQLGPRSSSPGGSGEYSSNYSQAPQVQSANAPVPHPPPVTPNQPVTPQVKTAISDAEIPIIQEDEPIKEPVKQEQAPQEESQEKPADTPSSAENNPENPKLDESNNPFEKPSDEIDVKDIPF